MSNKHEYVVGGYSFYQIHRDNLKQLFNDAGMNAEVSNTRFRVEGQKKEDVDKLLADNNIGVTKQTETLVTNIPLSPNDPI